MLPSRNFPKPPRGALVVLLSRHVWLHGAVHRPRALSPAAQIRPGLRDHRLWLKFFKYGHAGIPIILTAFGEAAALPLFLVLAFHGLLIFSTGILLMELSTSSPRSLRGLSRPCRRHCQTKLF